MNLEALTLHVKRHGFSRTVFVYVFKALRRLIDFDLMQVENLARGATRTPEVGSYITREVTWDEYKRASQWLGDGHERSWAFERGDRCFANLLDSRLVGYQFYARKFTTAAPGLEFRFPDSMTYGYASFTHPDHRGRRLAELRSNARRRADRVQGIKRDIVGFVSVDNLASLAVSRRFRSGLIGYVGYVKIGTRYFCYASRGCKRAKVSLFSTYT